MYLKIAFLLFVFTFKNVESQISKDPECIKQGAEVETTLRDLLFVTDRYKFFETKQDLDVYCSQAKKLIDDSKLLKKKNCLTKLAQQVFNTLIPRFRAFTNLRCKKDTDLTLRLAKCTVDKNRSPIRKCFLDYSNIIKYTANEIEDPTKMLALLCCNYHRVLKCLSSKEFQDCDDIRSSKFALDTVDGFMKDIFSLLCSKFTPTSCAQEGYMQELDNVQTKRGNINEFIIIPALRIADKLGD